VKRLRRVLVWLVVVLIAVGGLGWCFLDELLLNLVGFAMRRRLPVGPNQAIAWSTGTDARPAGERPPNVVLIVADDLGWNDVTAGGGGVAGGSVPTPAIDSIAREGVRFTSGYSANGTCAPSRAALMSGRYGTRFGFEFTPTPPGMSTLVPMVANGMPGRLREVVTHDDAGPELPFGEMGMPASEITLAELLKPAGYHSVHIGKWHLGGEHGMAPHEQGFDESLDLASGLHLPVGDPNGVEARQEFDPIDRFLWHALDFAARFNGGPAFRPAKYLTDYYTDEAVKVIEANKDRPFFLYLAYWAPHTPLQATKEDYDALAHIEDHRTRVYAAMIRALDRGVGRVLQALRDNGLDENTLVVFTSDNGAPGYLGLDEVNEPFRGWKITLFEGGIRVPYFMRWPGTLPAGVPYSAPVHGFDVYATAAAAAGVALPSDRVIDGVDLVPYVRGEREGAPHRALFWRSGHYRVVLQDGWKLQVNERPPGSVWLFDLNTDPTEQKNLATERPDKVAELRAALDAHDAEQQPSLWPSLVEMPVNIDKTLAEPDAPDDEYIYWPN